KVSKRKKKVVVSSDSKGSDADDFSELKKIDALLAKAFNRRKFYSKLTNNNLRTSSTSQSANKKQEFVKLNDKKVKKKDDEKKRDIRKKDKDEQVLLAEVQDWMESSSDSDQEINANMVFMAQIEKVLLDSETSSLSADDKISEVSYYLSESENESEYETSDYYDNTTTYEKIIIDLEDEVVSLLEKEKANLETIECLKSQGFESSENAISKSENQSENDGQVVEKECDKVENSKVIAPGMFKLSVSQCVSLISVTETSFASKNVENKTKRKRPEAIAMASFIQNRLIIHKRYDKTHYELMNKRKPNIKFFRVLGCRCYILNDYEDVGKLKAKGDIGVFVGYSKESPAFRIYNKRTSKIHESVNVNFDEISEMASKQFI
nr:copia protein [Tanacetum cinerariifolium]